MKVWKKAVDRPGQVSAKVSDIMKQWREGLNLAIIVSHNYGPPHTPTLGDAKRACSQASLQPRLFKPMYFVVGLQVTQCAEALRD